MFTDSRFWISSAERAIKTFAQALVALIGTSAMSIINLDWPQMLGVAATAAVVSLLTSIASANFGPNPGPSLAEETIEDPLLFEVQIAPAAAPAAPAPKKAAAKKAPAKKTTAKKTAK